MHVRFWAEIERGPVRCTATCVTDGCVIEVQAIDVRTPDDEDLRPQLSAMELAYIEAKAGEAAIDADGRATRCA